jgi:GT2 family glycosyltransferase
MLLTIAVWDTVENKRTNMTQRTLESISKQVNLDRHRLVISDNGSCQETQDMYIRMGAGLSFTVIKNGENLGTARAINRGWSLRKPGEHVLKMDNDVVVNHAGWADEMEEVFERDSSIGIVGLKRKDLAECPDHEVPHYRSILKMLSHQPGQRWIVIEEVGHVMGTCQAYSSALLDKIGYLYQGQDEGKKYGLDDTLASFRAHLVGFKTVFLPHIDIDHIDPGQSEYTEWKQKVAGATMGFDGGENWLEKVRLEYMTGRRPVYWKDAE